MAANIPVSNADVLATLNLANLENKTDITAMLTAHQGLVMAYLEQVLTDDDYAASVAVSGDSDVSRAAAVKLAYSYIMGAKTLHLLNLSTSGKGVIKKSGIDQRAAQNWSAEEIKLQREYFMREALDAIDDYLSSVGIDKQAELKISKAGTMRSHLVGNGDNDLPWWWQAASTDDA